MNTIIESVLMSLAIATPICIVFGKAYYDLKNEISNWKPRLWDSDNTMPTKHYINISNEIYTVRQMIEKDYLDKHTDVEHGVGDCIFVGGGVWRIDQIEVCTNSRERDVLRMEAVYEKRKESEDE